GALARMRLAGDHKHAQFVAYAVDGDDGPVIDGRELAVERCRLDLHDVRSRVRDRDLDAHGVADPYVAIFQRLAVAADRDLHRPGRHAGILDAEGDRLRLADDAEARGGDEHDPAIALVRVPAD